ncbi:hypothetical protein L596_010600 [Steinernema carpocapsae]|uniref:Uncharacterized protein n=1 Tax=Steinernema carpocapsae TaxID=34508 RepID=A0A4U5PIT4_STECR|nr:hypothetical protein L596_010600 [Steinernema carpocapsae]
MCLCFLGHPVYTRTDLKASKPFIDVVKITREIRRSWLSWLIRLLCCGSSSHLLRRLVPACLRCGICPEIEHFKV